MRLRKEDIELADRIIADLLNAGMLDQSKMQSFRHKRVIAILAKKGYIKDARTHLLQTDTTELYFEDGGATAIYKEELNRIIEDKIKLIGIIIAAIAGMITICEAIVSKLHTIQD